jgi:cytochrome c556
MSWIPRALAGAGVVALSLAACSPERPNPAATAVTPSQIVASRQAAMRLAAADFQLIRTAAEKGADLRTLAGPARSLAQWAAALPGMFPPGTGPDVANTRARAEIWTDRAGFEQRAAEFASAAARLAELAEAADLAEGGRQWDAARLACAACHDRYRSEISSR